MIMNSEGVSMISMNSVNDFKSEGVSMMSRNSVNDYEQ
jgi:hypothetical protein